MSEAGDLLEAWGRWKRRVTSSLGYPRTSPIARMVEHVKAYGRQKQSRTATGRQKRVMKPREIEFPPKQVAEVNRLVESLPAREQAAIYRARVFLQPDRISARELGVSRRAYTALRERAEQAVVRRISS